MFRLKASAWMFGEGSGAIGVSNSVLFRVVGEKKGEAVVIGPQLIGFGWDPAGIKSVW